MKTIYHILILATFSITKVGSVGAQPLPPIQLDRPDQTECPFITPTGYIQVENGLTYEYAQAGQTSLSYPTSLWKYGVNKHFEVRLITDLVTQKDEKVSTTGLIPITIGFKTAITDEKGLIPQIAFIGHYTTSHFGSKEFRTSFAAPSFRFNMQHTLTKKVSLAYNLGAEWDGTTTSEKYIYTFTTGITLTEKLGGYAELYGFISKTTDADHRCDAGLTYLINQDMMADLSGGYGLSKTSPKMYVSLGFSARFNTKH
jgi:Putative MetA-pathway of phenol degradation